jgi:predicted ATPase/class 3 adenylate cyclase
MTAHPTGTVTFLFTDIEGSTKLAREHPGEWDTAQARHHQILRQAIESHNGFVFQIIGDAFCAAFHKAGDALNAALQAQQGLQSEPWGKCVIRVRMGIHTGEAETDGVDYRGYLTLSLVQRLLSAGHGAQVLLSGPTENLVRGQLPKEVDLRDMGKHSFKDIPQSVRVFQVVVPGLQTEFPALRTPDTHPNNLPAQLTSFIGREKELGDVKRLLQNTHLLTLIGPGGTGKTRLSIQGTREILDHYPDGAWLVELAPILDPVLVPRTTAIAIGLRDEPQRPVLDMLCDYLRGKSLLLILDNCEHLVDACAQMANKILQAAPDVRILASSREALGIGGEVTYRVPSLGLPDLTMLATVETLSQYEAVRLFIDRATSAVPTFAVTNENAPAVAQICHRLDGIPLAIELAAAKIRVLGVEQIAKRLDDRFRLLTGGSRTALERHQTLRAAIDWSYNLLPASEQILFRRLAIFVGGWTLEAAESICVDELIKTAEVLELLEQLINKSLVLMEETQGQTRYRMLETMRQYANEKLVEAGESDVLRDRHLDYFLNLAETAEPYLIRPEQLEWLAMLDADYENLRLALEWALSKETAEPSLRLCAALGHFWEVRGFWIEGSKWLLRALSQPSQPSKNEDIARVRALYEDAALAQALDDLDRMKSSAERSLTLAQRISDKKDITIARFFLGWAIMRQGQYDSALKLQQQNFADFHDMQDPYWEANTYTMFSNILVKRGEMKQEHMVFSMLQLARKAGERQTLGIALLGCAYYLLSTNQLEKAKIYAEEAQQVFQPLGSPLHDTNAFFAHVAWLQGDYVHARAVFLAAEERCRLLGEKNNRSGAVGVLGLLAFQQGDITQAQACLEEALLTARELGNRVLIVYFLAELGNVYYAQGKTQEFKRYYEESFTVANVEGSVAKLNLLSELLHPVYDQNVETVARILGVLYYLQTEAGLPSDPLLHCYYDRAEAHARQVLSSEKFEAAFAKGQRLSLDEALNLAQDIIEAM